MRFLLAICFFPILLACSAQTKTVPLSEKTKIMVAMDLSFPPFEGIDTQGSPYGISVDMAHDLGVAMGKDIEILNVKWEGLIPGLRSGQYDLVISSMSITEERERVIDFSIPYGEMGIDFITQKNFVLQDVSQLNSADVRLAVRKGTIGESLALNNYPNAKIVSLGDFESAVLEVLQDKADVALADPLTVYEFQKKYPDQVNAVYLSQNTIPLGIAMSETADPNLKIQVNEFLKAYIEAGKLDALGSQYLAGIKEEFAKQNQPFFLF
ncbi:MAG: transporter substrate-binding domain-containing protein [Spirochaetia bacterium]